MKQALLEYGRSIGIEYMGIAPATADDQLRKILRERRDCGSYTEFEEADVEKRVEINKLMPETQSVVVCLFPYYTGEVTAANVSRYTYARDYHVLVKDKLKQIGGYLESAIPGFVYQAYADTGPLVDRFLAYLAGLGFYGLNSLLINEKYGSYFFIGYLLTSYPFVSDHPQKRVCCRCGRCVKHCPGQAIRGDFSIKPLRCRSYITQKKGDLSQVEQDILSKSGLVFGCDICQEVCPHNQQIPVTGLQEFTEDILPLLQYEELMGLSNKEFKVKFGNRAFSWRGKGLLLRNFQYINKSDKQ